MSELVNLEKTDKLRLENLDRQTSIDNITFTDINCIQNDFERTLKYVKGFSSSWDTHEKQKNKVSEASNSQTTQKLQNDEKKDITDNEFDQSENSKFKWNITSQQTELRSWGLPPEILNKYHEKGIVKMFHWQIECLGNHRVLNENRNLVYSAPTSAGKTLVSEILAIKTVLERQKKVMVILPFVSVVREKMFYFQDILTDSGIRVEGFMGSRSPPGGFEAVHVAICTIEKANSLVNHLLEDGTISDLGAVVVDELHLLGDPSRGYILELLLTKLLYVSKRYEHVTIQIIGMSATLPNLSLLSNWLDAELYKTDFRPIPLNELCQIDNNIYDSNLTAVRKIESNEELPDDKDNIVQFCLETITNGCSVLIFCPTKSWCENLAKQISSTFRCLGYSNTSYGSELRKQLDGAIISETLNQLKASPVGLDAVLCETISFGVAFHHAGLTMDERDIIEGAFKRNAIRVLIATSTLSSGVNLPARRVIIRSPTFNSKPISILTYKQMIGRAGRMGIDTSGESILICSKNDKQIAKDLISGMLDPIASCLEGGDKLMRAILESIASRVASTPDDVKLFTDSTLLMNSLSPDESTKDFSDATVRQLIEYELVRLQNENNEVYYSPTALGKACLSSSMSPKDGLTLFKELQKARESFVLETDLHMIYLVTPYSICSQWGNINWLHFLNLWDNLSRANKRVGELVGIKESLIYNFMRGTVQMKSPAMFNKLQILKRFYTALALQDLVNEVPLCNVADSYNCSRGMLQSLQQSAATFAGMVTAFSRQLGWKSFEILVSQFQHRLHFGIQADLLDLMRLESLNGMRARALFNAGIESVSQLASSNICSVENALHSVIPFQSDKERDGEEKYDAQRRNNMKVVWITGRKGVGTKEAADLLITEARDFIQKEMGVDVKWKLKESNKRDLESQNLNRNSYLYEKSNLLSPDKPRNSFMNSLVHNNSCITSENKVDSVSTILKNNNTLNAQMQVQHSTPNSAANSIRISDKVDTCDITMESLNISDNDLFVEDVIKNLSIRSNKEFIDNNLASVSKCNDGNTGAFISSDDSSKTGTKSSDQLSSLSTSYKSTVSECSSEVSKELSMFEESFSFNTELCEIIDNGHNNTINEEIANSKTSLNDNLTSLENVFSASFNDKTASPLMLCSAQKLNDTIYLSPPLQEKSIDVLCSQLDDVIKNSQIYTTPSVSPFRNTKQLFSKSAHSMKTRPNGKRKKLQNNLTIRRSICKNKLVQSPLKQIKLCHENIENTKILNVKEKSIQLSTLLPNYPTKDQSKIMITVTCLENEHNKTQSKIVLSFVNACSEKAIFEKCCLWLKQYKCLSFFIDYNVYEKKTSAFSLIGSNVLKKNGNLHKEAEKENIGDIYNFIIKGFAICVEDFICYFKLNHNNSLVSANDVLTFLKSLFADKFNVAVMHGIKKQFLALNKCGIRIDCLWEDPSVADWLLDPECDPKSLDKMVDEYCPFVECKPTKNDSHSNVDNDAHFSSVCINAWKTWNVMKVLKNILLERHSVMVEVFGNEMKALKVLSESEVNGIGVDKHVAEEILNRIKTTQALLEKSAFKITGRQFRFSSPSEVAKILCMDKGYKISTNKQTLQRMDNPVAQLVIYWRKLSVIMIKNLFPLTAKAVNNDDSKRIFGSYWTHTSTGRISMQEPNLQSVPRNFTVPSNIFMDQPDGHSLSLSFNCRNMFLSAAGSVLVSADYCQLELRLLAHLSKDETLQQIVRSDGDIFKAIASSWKNISQEEVEDDLRQKTKQMCYGIIYGMGSKSLAQTLDICELEASVFLKTFHNAYPMIKVFTKSVIEQCQSSGFVETLSGRRRYLPSINSKKYSEKSHAERQAVNTAIQGSAADILKSAMIMVSEKVEQIFEKPEENKLVLPMHDELIFEVPIRSANEFIVILKRCMETTVDLSVPLPVKLKMGYSWGDMDEVII